MEGQDAYALTNLRVGGRGKFLFAEALGAQRVRHAIHPGGVRLRPAGASGFIGEMGRPRTFGVNAGVTF